MLQLDNDQFYQCIQVIAQKNYEHDQIESLKHIFSTQDDEYVEKLKLMKLEQDAQAKQKNMSTFAKKRVKPENMQGIQMLSTGFKEPETNIIEFHEQQMIEYVNPYYKVQAETRQRLARYGIRGYQDAQNDFYSLKYVKIDPKDLEDNPILRRGQEHQQAKGADASRGAELEALDEEILQEMRDTIQINQQSPSELLSEYVFS